MQNAKQKWIFGATLLISLALIFVVYQKSLSYPFINWDDSDYVTQNSLIKTLNFDSIQKIFSTPQYFMYTPITTLSYAIQYWWFGPDPSGFHLTNILIHLANTLLVCWLVWLLTSNTLISLGVMIIFAIHPVQVESVVWISQTKTLLSTFFALGALIQYILNAQSQNPREFKNWGALGLFILACLCKYSVVILPLVLCLYQACFDKKQGWFKKTLPFFFVSALGVALTFMTASGEIHHDFISENGSSTFLSALVILMRYLELVVLPLPFRQSLIYTLPIYTHLTHPHVLLAIACLLLMISAWIWLWIKDKKLFFWSVWPIAFLLPVLHIVPIQNLMNDRYLYVALIGFFTCITLWIHQKIGRWPVLILFFILIAIYLPLNLARQNVWASSEIMWKDVEQKNPEGNISTHLPSAPGHNLGNEYLRQGKFEPAIAEFKKALQINPYPETYGSLAIAYYQQGQIDLAIENLNIAIKLRPQNPNFYNSLGLIYIRQKQYAQAIDAFQKALSKDPKPALYNNLASVFILQNNESEAEANFLKSLKLDPDFSDALLNVGLLYHRKAMDQKASIYLNRWVRLNPNHPKITEIKKIISSLGQQA